ncbi:MAG: SDR family oxidoreductase [Spirochaetes bacterium]|nr:SDR family oxidoreductase [Spirochaetota bacterium]
MNNTLFSLKGKTVVITGGTGVLGTAMVKALVDFDATVAVITRDEKKFNEKMKGLSNVFGVTADIMSTESMKNAAETVIKKCGTVDILVNGAGGNQPGATTSDTNIFFDMPIDAIRDVMHLNFFGGAFIASQVFAREMVKNDNGTIINISSMASMRPLTKVLGYGAAKAAVNNFTQWLAVHINQNYNKKFRVNAIAPGFFLTEQNRFLMINKDTGELSPRAQSIVGHTPMGRFGDPEDLIGALIWLCSDSSKFVNGQTIAVDGGFSAFSGV